MRQRIAYLCDYFFAGDVVKLAAAVDCYHTTIRDVLRAKCAVTVRLVAQISRQLNVRLDWLLYGTGDPVLSGDVSPEQLHLPTTLASTYALFDTTTTAPAAPMSVSAQDVGLEAAAVTDPHFSLAIAVHAARARSAPVLLCLSDVAVHAGAYQSLPHALAKKYVTALAITGGAAVADMARARQSVPDMNLLARLAANQGTGYGEALARWGFSPDAQREKSVICSAYDAGLVFSAHVEIGELVDHLRPAARGAEVGAAFGAATYVDFLVFTEQVRQITEHGGVVVTVGPAERFFQLLAAAAQAVEAGPESFCVGILDRANATTNTDIIQPYCDCLHVVSGSCGNNLTTFFRACDAVYCGNIPNEFKK